MPHTKIAVCGASVLLFSGLLLFFKNLSQKIVADLLPDIILPEFLTHFFETGCKVCLLTGILLIFTSVVVGIRLPEASHICLMVKKRLFCHDYGNPLHLKEGERLPKVRCKKKDSGIFELTITATTTTVEDIQNLSGTISSGINKKHFKQYAVTQTFADIAFNEVTFLIEDVTIDKSFTASTVQELKPKEPDKLIIQKGTYLGLRFCGSMIFCGKTRSGKTLSVITILISVLLCGRDAFGSEIIIIDPKQAELSRLPHVVTLDKDGGATAVLDAIRHFADTITKRQQILNDLSEKKGDAVKWWDAGFHPSLLFIDEYVACRTLFPKRSTKENADYSLAEFDALVKRIVTMGASSGSFVIISIAQASVDEAGLPSMLKSAMTTKVLFKPTMEEARFLWDSNSLTGVNTGRVYHAGDAWFSSTDGVHDAVSYVHFPVLNFAVYHELGKLLDKYYKDE